MTPNIHTKTEYLGKSLKGDTYHLGADGYVYQRFANVDKFIESGENKNNMWNGWISSWVAWDNAMHRLLVSGPDFDARNGAVT
jgi:hypothetical protein